MFLIVPLAILKQETMYVRSRKSHFKILHNTFYVLLCEEQSTSYQSMRKRQRDLCNQLQYVKTNNRFVVLRTIICNSQFNHQTLKLAVAIKKVQTILLFLFLCPWRCARKVPSQHCGPCKGLTRAPTARRKKLGKRPWRTLTLAQGRPVSWRGSCPENMLPTINLEAAILWSVEKRMSKRSSPNECRIAFLFKTCAASQSNEEEGDKEVVRADRFNF